MFNYIRNLFTKNKNQAKAKPMHERLLDLPIASYVVLTLNPDICVQHIAKGITRFDANVLTNKQLKGLVKAVYVSEDVGQVYVELVGLVVKDGCATRKDYVAMGNEIVGLTILD